MPRTATKDEYGPRLDLDGLQFADQIKQRREEIGLSQDQLGLLAGLSRGSVRNAELGKPLGQGTVAALERAVGWRYRPDHRMLTTPFQVLSAAAVYGVASTITEDRLFPSEAIRDRLVADFGQLVESLEDTPPSMPPVFERFVTLLRPLVRPVDAERLFDDIVRAGVDHREVSRLTGLVDGSTMSMPRDLASVATYVHHLVDEQEAQLRVLKQAGATRANHPILLRAIRGAVNADEAFLIARSGLRETLQDAIAQYLTRRRDEFNLRTMAELRALVEYLGGRVS